MHHRVQRALIVSSSSGADAARQRGLLMKSLWHLQQVDPGFRADEVLTFQTSLPLARYAEGDEIPFYQQLEDRLRPLPGVLQVGAVNILPLSGNYSCDGFDIVGRPPSPAGQQPCAEERSITPGYLNAMGIPLRRGRGFTRQDVEGSRPVMVISDTMAQRFWPDTDPVGSQIVYGGKPREVVGIVAAVKHLALDRDTPPEMYTPHAQQPSFHTMTLVVRSAQPDRSDGDDSPRNLGHRSRRPDGEHSRDARRRRRHHNGAEIPDIARRCVRRVGGAFVRRWRRRRDRVPRRQTHARNWCARRLGRHPCEHRLNAAAARDAVNSHRTWCRDRGRFSGNPRARQPPIRRVDDRCQRVRRGELRAGCRGA